jgi:hypothetical protein
MLSRLHDSVAPLLRGNRFDRMEWAGAFGDLGTLIPFVVAYLSMLSFDPFGVLFSFGAAMIVCGFVYRTPLPVQPMKAIGAIATTQAAQTLTVTAGAVYAAGLASGVIWLLLGLTGTAQKAAKLVGRPGVIGIILGLGFGFMGSGVKLMADNWWIGGLALGGTLLLLGNRRVPLTMGNAIIAITEENNREFPDRPVTEQRVAVSTGLMNLGSAALGGIPMCHGAGGMAGHVRFGARTGSAPIILGAILVLLASSANRSARCCASSRRRSSASSCF